ncbi:hypothetical protein WR25_21549 [Diploscapter pachys]|uniref:Uncharacterized protein n=1 Tax=Diploscapter pachys TaxID=2018661 RepID=A0A2A2JNG0_9BILA|nr:hypothetical protein WR25_21549 [Diploscapter pachys]
MRERTDSPFIPGPPRTTASSTQRVRSPCHFAPPIPGLRQSVALNNDDSRGSDAVRFVRDAVAPSDSNSDDDLPYPNEI